MSRIAQPSRLHLTLVSFVVFVLLLSQALILVLSVMPSSTTAWLLYFEYARRVDVVFRVFSAWSVHLGPPQFIGLLALLLIAGEAAVRYRIRLLEAVVLHAVFFMVLLVLLDNVGALQSVWAMGGPTAGSGLVLVTLVAASGVPIAAACFNHHLRYLREGAVRAS